jgi:hypothetical protein
MARGPHRGSPHTCSRKNAFRASIGERAQPEPSAEQRADTFVALEADRTCGDRVGEAQPSEPHRGQCRNDTLPNQGWTPTEVQVFSESHDEGDHFPGSIGYEALFWGGQKYVSGSWLISI